MGISQFSSWRSRIVMHGAKPWFRCAIVWGKVAALAHEPAGGRLSDERNAKGASAIPSPPAIMLRKRLRSRTRGVRVA